MPLVTDDMDDYDDRDDLEDDWDDEFFDIDGNPPTGVDGWDDFE